MAVNSLRFGREENASPPRYLFQGSKSSEIEGADQAQYTTTSRMPRRRYREASGCSTGRTAAMTGGADEPPRRTKSRTRILCRQKEPVGRGRWSKSISAGRQPLFERPSFAPEKTRTAAHSARVRDNPKDFDIPYHQTVSTIMWSAQSKTRRSPRAELNLLIGVLYVGTE
jgi:hypothetical protein